VDQAYAELEKNRDQVRLYREAILPQAQINYRAASEAYSVGAIDFLTYVRAANDLDRYEGETAERETGVGRALAMLQKASGLPLIEGTPGPGDIHAEE
jgi:outer membrane protein TolC